MFILQRAWKKLLPAQFGVAAGLASFITTIYLIWTSTNRTLCLLFKLSVIQIDISSYDIYLEVNILTLDVMFPSYDAMHSSSFKDKSLYLIRISVLTNPSITSQSRKLTYISPWLKIHEDSHLLYFNKHVIIFKVITYFGLVLFYDNYILLLKESHQLVISLKS